MNQPYGTDAPLQRIQAEYCDSMNTVLDDMIADYRNEVSLKDNLIRLEREQAGIYKKEVKQAKKRNVVTIGLASIITALSLFVAIR